MIRIINLWSNIRIKIKNSIILTKSLNDLKTGYITYVISPLAKPTLLFPPQY